MFSVQWMILIALALLNVFVWIATLAYWQTYPLLLGLVALAYGLGLRHAVDADHIAAIDNTTRKLMNDGKKPLAVGLFFSLGHSTIVVVLSILVAFSATFVKTHLPMFEQTGSFIGMSVSSIFLLALGIINFITFIDIFKTWRIVKKKKQYSQEALEKKLHTNGLFTRLLRPVLRMINHSWQMYFLGFLFGLGFDTATEVGLLSLAATSGATGLPFFALLLIPLAFTAGMSLIDTLDGMFMLKAYGWAYVKPIKKLYYNMQITLISVIIALFIGGIQMLQLLSFYTFDLGNVGYFVIGIFVVSWLVSMIIYKVKRYDQLV